MTAVNLTREDQVSAVEDLVDAVDRDDRNGLLDVERADRGRAAGEVPKGEAVRIAAEAYLGSLDTNGGRHDE